jgi:hypothetical protein
MSGYYKKPAMYFAMLLWVSTSDQCGIDMAPMTTHDLGLRQKHGIFW